MERIVRNAVKEEERRLRLLAEEEARRAALAEKTRLVVEFISQVSGFFCSKIRLLPLSLDGGPVEGAASAEMACRDRTRLLDRPVSAGTHTVTVAYEKENHGDRVQSRPQTFTVEVEPGKTTVLECRTRGHLLYWGVDGRTRVTASP